MVTALAETHPLSSRDEIRWSDLKGETLLLPQRGPGREFHQLLMRKMGAPGSCKIVQHDVSLDRLLTLVGANCGILLALEGATGATYPGVVFREVSDETGPTRLAFRAHWQQTNPNPSLRSFLELLRQRYPDLSAGVQAS